MYTSALSVYPTITTGIGVYGNNIKNEDYGTYCVGKRIL